MTGNTPHDIELKMNLLDDVFSILDLEKMYNFIYFKILIMIIIKLKI